MRQELAQGHGTGATAPDLDVRRTATIERVRLLGRLMKSLRSIATDLGEEGTRIVLVLAAFISLFAIMGAIHAKVVSMPAFDLSGEQHFNRGLTAGMNFPALFSGLVLLVPAALALLVANRIERYPWALLGVLFAYMGTDEVMKIHETLANAIGIRWEVLYLPVGVAAGVFWLSGLRRMSQFESERMLWVGGAAAWLIAQIFEVIGNTFGSGIEGAWAWAEEILEMSGSSMFLLTLYLVWRRQAAMTPGPSSTSSSARRPLESRTL
jgi:hypothetical protein